MKPSRIARLCAITGLLATLGGVLGWFGWIARPPGFGLWPAVLLAVPLLFPLPGMIRGKTYTHAWTSMLSLLYVMLAMTEALATPAVRAIALLVLFSSLLLFAGCVLFVRFSARERQG